MLGGWGGSGSCSSTQKIVAIEVVKMVVAEAAASVVVQIVL